MLFEGFLACLDGRLEDVVALARRVLEWGEEMGVAAWSRASLTTNSAFARALLHLGQADEALQLSVWPGQPALCLAHLGQRDRVAGSLDRRVVARPEIGSIEDETPAQVDIMYLEAAVLVEHQQAAELLKPRGLQQAYHNHWWEMTDFDGKRGLEIFLENAPDVHAQLDVYWACRFGEVDVPALLGRWKTRCSTLHIKDGPLIEGEPHTAVGAGRMDIPAVIGAADAETLQWLIVELDHCATDMLTAVRQSIDYLTANGLGEAKTRP